MSIAHIVKIFQEECNYININKISKVQMRNKNKGIQLHTLFYYRFLYSKNNTTKQQIVSSINYTNGIHFSRQSYEKKENNIPVEIYKNILNKISKYFNDTHNNINNVKLIAIDGTYNNDDKMNEIMNLGINDVTNDVPIDIKSYGKENKNREIYSTMDYINKNMHIFKNNIIVADRGYFSYNFLQFLMKNNLKFIIRAKGQAEYLKSETVVKKSMPNAILINSIKKNIRVITYNNILEKIIYTSNSKKSMGTNLLKIKNDCVIVTNILDDQIYTNSKILELYRSRWDIEVLFKHIKSNFKFQHMKEKNKLNYNKMYIVELIIMYIAKIIEKNYEKQYPTKQCKKEEKYKINKSNLINGIFNFMINDILENKVTPAKIDQFYESFVITIKSKLDRSFPRTAKTPFKKWYIKGYSDHTKFMKIINAVTNGTINELNKNLKVIANKIISINGKEYG